MQQYGMRKTYYVKDEKGEIKDSIPLVFNTYTLILYKNYTGKDLMQDLTAISLSGAKQQSKLSDYMKDKLQKEEFDSIDWNKLSDSDIDAMSKLNTAVNVEFIINFVVALMATAQFPKIVDYVELINSIPMEMLNDKEFNQTLFDLMLFGLNTVKKK